MTKQVRAAGGVVWRRGPSEELEVVLVHRPRYDDWTFPKGKNHPGESDEDCAVREVEEETGLVCSLGPELPTLSYRDSRGREKAVRYWAMEPVTGELGPQNEVDDVRWVGLALAERSLSYDRDRQVLAAFAGVTA